MLFKILQGPSSRIDTETTPLHEGYSYFTPDTGNFYIDAKVNDELKRIQINPDEVFRAVRNDTTYEEIAAAQARGCTVLCVDGSVVYQLTSLNTSKKTALFVSGYEVDDQDVVHFRAWTVSEDDDGSTTWSRHSKVTTEAVVDTIVEQNTQSEQKFWRGTKAEFDAIEEKDDSVMYIVTDEDGYAAIDTSATLYDAPGDATDGAMTQAASTQYFVQKDNTVAVSTVAAASTDDVAQALTDAKTYTDEKIAGNVVDAFTKAESLTEATAALYGLDSSAVPDDVLSLVKSLIDQNAQTASGGAKIQTGSYVGTGTYGADNPCSLTFDFKPYLVVVVRGDYFDAILIAVNGMNVGSCTPSPSNTSAHLPLSWGQTQLRWYTTQSNAPSTQLNGNGCTYNYVAVGF